ncbi:cytochrome c oxidase assembly protein [Evansella cellulosilytica]|uniref:Cytochrome c oxidase caa3-type, assembly factor CtaG-related protein n=1 Tax=Evansella cellulosilytica (strain ATCC 21833 / DSM 2522 / FERM P-1141 / JCM 9156 / N-4) TaxID=649639 RepID=E6TW71_EVAC2|nr:cytochrome c oxidase assembly protein [Evansella cellulosilytica]ADU31027.1 Cytochrome c oxidase caa3-type, assembly factor CtaG-related protein [Evansella cellulosilytica DSM 2522]
MDISQHTIHHHHIVGVMSQFLLASPFIVSLVIYVMCVLSSNRHYSKWPIKRTLFFFLGVTFAVISLWGPLAEKAHHDFKYHMIGHLFLGMLSPLLIVLSSPMVLFLRSINRSISLSLIKVIHGNVVRVYFDPTVATILNLGGLWILYKTNLYVAMHQNTLIYMLVHLHVFIAGYLFTAAMIDKSVMISKVSFLYRSVVLVIALAAHGILSKVIYSSPPHGVLQAQAEAGAQIMYYGGDIIDATIIFILFLQWFKWSKPRIKHI